MSKAKSADQRTEVPQQEQTRAPRIIGEEDIAARAYALYLSRQCEDGHDVDDWFRAERELLQADLEQEDAEDPYGQ